MTEKELEKKYKELVANIESARIYDGRNQGIDVYVCEKCGHEFYTRYKDKGVTPFIIKCRNCEKGTAVHKDTISTMTALAVHAKIHDWIRPSFEQLDKYCKKGKEGLVQHILDGGLILDDER